MECRVDFYDRRLLVWIAKDWVAFFVELVRHCMLSNPIMPLDLIQLKPFVRLILEKALDQITGTIFDNIGKCVLGVHNALVRFSLFLAFEWW